MLLVVDLGRTKLGLTFEHPREIGSDGKLYPVKTKCRLFGIRDGGEPLMIAKGDAKCCALDNFNKSKGRKLALTRAIANLKTLTKAERTRIWEAYLSRGGNPAPIVPPTSSPAPVVEGLTTEDVNHVVGTGTIQ